MGKLFGTDGIRGIFNEEPMTPEMGFKVGRAVVRQYEREGSRQPRIVVGRDTRLSGKVLQDAIVSGLLSLRVQSILVGEMPTPGVAFLTRELGADAGIMISASHNPYEYNGFKIFSHEGDKLSDEVESRIEDLIYTDTMPAPRRKKMESAGEQEMAAAERYLSFLQQSLREGSSFKGMKIVLDCANGATYRVAPMLFERMGAEVQSLFVAPNGRNINQDCGSQHPETLSERVVETSAHVGLAFDGDGDRMIAVDEKGNVLTGDQVLVICAKMLKEQGELKNNLVVSTVMSNMGFRVALKKMGIGHRASKVGDRYVLEEMRKSGAILGGEESGHIIFLQHHATGDGLLSALHLLSAMRKSGQSLSRLSTLMTVFPQVLINVPVKKKPEISSVPELVRVQQNVEMRLGERGRVLLRYSGTEPVCRIMVEGERQEEIEEYARQMAEVVKKQLS